MIMHSESRDQTAAAIGTRVREARRELGLRQDELAVVAGVSTRAVHQIEAGKASSRLDILQKVLDALGMRLSVEKRSRVPRREREERE